MHTASAVVRNTVLFNPALRPSTQISRNVTKIASYLHRRPVKQKLINQFNVYGLKEGRICSYNSDFLLSKQVSNHSILHWY